MLKKLYIILKKKIEFFINKNLKIKSLIFKKYKFICIYYNMKYNFIML